MQLETVTGLASISAWDQSQAEAMDKMRACRAFVLLTLDDLSGAVTIHALSRDVDAATMEEILRMNADASEKMADELAEEAA